MPTDLITEYERLSKLLQRAEMHLTTRYPGVTAEVETGTDGRYIGVTRIHGKYRLYYRGPEYPEPTPITECKVAIRGETSLHFPKLAAEMDRVADKTTAEVRAAANMLEKSLSEIDPSALD